MHLSSALVSLVDMLSPCRDPLGPTQALQSHETRTRQIAVQFIWTEQIAASRRRDPPFTSPPTPIGKLRWPRRVGVLAS